MAGNKQPDQQAVTVTRQPDGRHAVTDASGNVLGLHNSPVSAARQVSSYLGAPTAEPMEPGVQHTLAGTPAPGAPGPMVMSPAQQIAAQQAVQGRLMAQGANPPQQAVTPGSGVTPPGSVPSSTATMPSQSGALQAALGQAALPPTSAQLAAPQLLAQHAANVALVSHLAGPNGPAATPAAQLQAYQAFHQPATAAAAAFGPQK